MNFARLFYLYLVVICICIKCVFKILKLQSNKVKVGSNVLKCIYRVVLFPMGNPSLVPQLSKPSTEQNRFRLFSLSTCLQSRSNPPRPLEELSGKKHESNCFKFCNKD